MSNENNAGHESGNNALTLGLSLLAGTGVVLMMLAGGIGVIDAGDGNVISLLFITGVALFIAGGVAWAGVVQPWTHFDDINIPAPDEHHGHDDHAADETALVLHEPGMPQPHH